MSYRIPHYTVASGCYEKSFLVWQHAFEQFNRLGNTYPKILETRMEVIGT